MKRILITGSSGMLGKAVCKKFKSTNANLIELKRNNADLTNPDELIECFHYLNTQPLHWKDNREKSNKF